MRRSITKHGTALMPSAAAVRSSSRTSAAKRSLASVVADLVGVEADVDREPLERGVVAHQLALAQVAAHQALLHRVLAAVQRREVHEPVRVERVAGARGLEVEVEPLARRRGGHLVLHRPRLLDARPVLAREVLGAVALALGRRAGVELEAAPGDADLVAVLEGGERGLEAALADVAPGAGDVGPDLDVHQPATRSVNHASQRATLAASAAVSSP